MSKSKYAQYTEIDWYGRNLLEKHSLNEIGVWSVHGADPNCDMGGPHHMPFLGYFEGKLEDVIRLAIELPRFWQWGGGEIKKVTGPGVVKVTPGTTTAILTAREEVRKAEESLEKAMAKLDSLNKV
jgi:hypothetical protein